MCCKDCVFGFRVYATLKRRVLDGCVEVYYDSKTFSGSRCVFRNLPLKDIYEEDEKDDPER